MEERAKFNLIGYTFLKPNSVENFYHVVLNTESEASTLC